MKQVYCPTASNKFVIANVPIALLTTGFRPIQALTKAPLRQTVGIRISSADRATTSANNDDQAWFWTPEWQAAEREVNEHIQAGRVERFDSIDDFLATL